MEEEKKLDILMKRMDMMQKQLDEMKKIQKQLEEAFYRLYEEQRRRERIG